MSFWSKTIFTGFSPNLNRRDTKEALAFLFLPWRWPILRRGKFVNLAERKIQEFFHIKHSFVFDSGRTALFIALKALGVGEGDRVLVQAYTCVVVVNAIKWLGAVPVFVDIEDDFNLDPIDLERKIDSRAKVLIIQHTFGLPAKLDQLLAIAKKNGLTVIEDCAHAFGVRHKGRLLGTFGLVGMYSFGTDKMLSCVRGGALTTNSGELAGRIRVLQTKLPDMPLVKIWQHLWHLPVFSLGKFFYNWYVGKMLLVLAKNFHLVNRIIYPPEKRGKKLPFFPARLPNSLARILLDQLREVEEKNKNRLLIAHTYNRLIKNDYVSLPLKGIDSECGYLRFPLLTDYPKKVQRFAKKRGIILGNWYDAVVAPADANLVLAGYVVGSCPKAERLAKRTINLPTDRQINQQTAERVAQVINSFVP